MLRHRTKVVRQLSPRSPRRLPEDRRGHARHLARGLLVGAGGEGEAGGVFGMRLGELYIGGRWVPALTGRRLPVVDPATEESFSTIACAGSQDVDEAVAAAQKAFDGDSWKGRDPASVARRVGVLKRVAERIAKDKKRLAALETADCGKPVEESEWDVDDAVACFEFFADVLSSYTFEQDVALPEADFMGSLSKEPLGVVALITPWNYPLLMAVWKVAPALASGCTVVLKPSEHASLTCLELAEVFHQSGCPAGVFNVVTGIGEEAGSALTRHPGVAKVAFTGSSATGRKVAEAMAQQVKPCTLELGGKSAIVVFPDCDIEKAVEWVMFGCFWTNGQICSATSRLILHEKIKAPFLRLLKQRAEAIPITDPKKVGSRLGPVINHEQFCKIVGMIQKAKQVGIQVLTGGSRPKGKAFARGYYIKPTVFVDPPEDSQVWREEIFGPVLCVRTFAGEEEAVAMANRSKFGLAAAVLTEDTARAKRVAAALQCGIVWVNCSQPCFVQLPWGGCKASGYGRDLSAAGLDNYLQSKQLVSYHGEKWDWYPAKPKAKL